MKVTYHLYKAIAVIVIFACWWAMLTPSNEVRKSNLNLIQNGLDYSLRKASHRNHFLAEELHLALRKYGPMPINYEYYRKSRNLQKQFKKLMSKIEDMKLQLQKLPLNDQAAVKNFMIHQKKGDSLKQAIDHYVDLSFTKYEYLGITEFKKIVEKSATSDFERKTGFTQFFFERTSPLLVNILLTQKQREITRYTKNILQRMQSKGLEIDLSFPFGTYLTYPTRQIQVGNDFTADLLVAQEPEGIETALYYGAELVPDYFSKRKIIFQPQGKGKQSWQGKFKYQYQGRDTVVTHNIPYTILSQKKPK